MDEPVGENKDKTTLRQLIDELEKAYYNENTTIDAFYIIESLKNIDQRLRFLESIAHPPVQFLIPPSNEK